MMRARPLLGTIVEIQADTTDAGIFTAAFTAVEQAHRLMSFHEPDSDLSRLNREAATRAVTVHPWTRAVLHAAQRFHRASAGLFDCTVARELTQWQLLPDTAAGTIMTGGMDDMLLLPHNQVRFRQPLLLDLGGIAKGFAVDMAVQALRRAGVREACVNAGGDLRVLGAQAHPIHVRSPADPRQLLPLGELAQGALATSGIYFSARTTAGREVSALVDAGTREPLLQPRSYSVLARSCMTADALTKVLAQVGGTDSALLRRFGAIGVIL